VVPLLQLQQVPETIMAVSEVDLGAAMPAPAQEVAAAATGVSGVALPTQMLSLHPTLLGPSALLSVPAMPILEVIPVAAG